MPSSNVEAKVLDYIYGHNGTLTRRQAAERNGGLSKTAFLVYQAHNYYKLSLPANKCNRSTSESSDADGRQGKEGNPKYGYVMPDRLDYTFFKLL